MDSIQELIDRYTRAQEDIEAEIEKQPRGTVKEYESTLTEKILAILAGLYLYTTKWSGKNIEKYYDTAMDDAVGAAQKEYRRKKKKPPAMGAKTAADSDAVSILRRNLEADLTGSVDFVGRQMQDEIRQAGLRASMEAAVRGEATEIMQQNLKQMLIDRGIPAIEYTRNGKKAYMQLDTYAELVARTTAREARNTANINLGQRIGNTLVLMSTHNNSCPICAPYQGRVYSTVPGNPDFPYLYDTPFSREYKTFHPRCEHVVTQYIMDLHSDEENRKMRELSNRSFEIGGEGWTKAQTERAERSLRGYWKGQQRKSRIYADKKQYNNYRIILGDDAPSTLQDFLDLKKDGGEAWEFRRLDYRRRKKLVDHPELALPNADRATAANTKFTKYLFNKNNADGWAKGRAFESRLGYNIDNWETLQKEIVKRAQIYPAAAGETDQYGTRYTQHIVIYGEKGKPANVRVGWKVKGDKTWLTTALIKEID